jgi:hypothetical protein
MSGNQEDGKAPVDYENGTGKSFKPCHEENKRDNQKAAYGRGFYNIKQIRDASVSPHTAVKVEKMEGYYFDKYYYGKYFIQ